MKTKTTFQGHVFISYARSDEKLATELRVGLEANGLRCWVDRSDVSAGANWGNEIAEAIAQAKALLLVLSAEASQSRWVAQELMLAQHHNIPIIPYRIGRLELPDHLSLLLSHLQFFDGVGPDAPGDAKRLAEAIRQTVPELARSLSTDAVSVDREGNAQGYVFVSYIRSDADFVERLRTVFESKRYGYWDYVVGTRDYHGALYRELEERIDGAVAFLTVVTDDWRKSDWVASEFIYAREAKIPIFVIQAKELGRPLPILLNLQTRIDMSSDFDAGVRVLVEELAKKGL